MELIDKGRIEEAVLSIDPRITTMASLTDGLDANRIERLQTKACTICYDSADVPCVTPCCMNVFCGRCIVTWITIKNSCPLCKEVIQASTLIKIDTGVRPKELSKLEALAEYLREGDGQERQIILFSRNVQEVYSYIVNNLPSLQDEVDILHGNKKAISNLVAEFTKKRIRVLCFSPESVGLDLVSATHILLMDRLHGEAIQRAQRIGRKVPLNVVRFCDWV
jgi:SNF2 family DNA or RNA helicase